MSLVSGSTAGIGYASDQREAATEEIVSGSASVRFPFGLNLTFAAGTADIDGAAEDPSYYYGKIGYRRTFFDNLGETRFGIDFAASEDFLTADGDRVTDLATATPVDIVSDDLFSIGAGVVQRIDPAAMDLYVGYRYHSLDLELEDGREPDVEAINAVLVGARVRF